MKGGIILGNRNQNIKGSMLNNNTKLQFNIILLTPCLSRDESMPWKMAMDNLKRY
jgi:hypothetical protein